ncbi:MAG: acyltransferase family protein [Faecousia sp.]
MRKTYIDNIRWITVVLVVIYHVIYMFNGIETFGVIGPFAEAQYQDAYQYIVYPWFMLLLFVVSGMSARFYLDHHSPKEFLKSRTTKLLVPSTIGLFVFWWILGYYNILIGGGLESMAAVPKPVFFIIMAVSGTGPLWYIQMLWFFSVILLLIRRIEKDKLYRLCENVNVPVLMTLTLVIWGAAQILNTPIMVVYRFGIYGAGFLFGYFIFSHDRVMEKLEKWWQILSLAALVLGAVFVAVFWGAPYAEHEVLDTFLCNLYAWTAVLAVLSVMKKWGNFENRFTRFMIRKSWGLYLFHYLPLAVCAWYLHEYPVLPAAAMYICVGIAAFAGAYLLYEIVSRIPVLRWCVCGIRGKNHVCR